MPYLLLISVFINIWLYKILSFNFFIALLVIFGAFVIYKAQNNKNYTKFLLFIFIILFIFQFIITNRSCLNCLTNLQKDQIQEKMRAYPALNIPVAHWFEERKESIIFFRLLSNISDVLSPNLYFTANHPNERFAFKEIEKFPYIYLPFFIIGLLKFDYKKNKRLLIISVVTPLLLYLLIGSLSPVGPFLLFPFIALSISNGLKEIFLTKNNKLIIGFSVLTILIFIQTIIYEKF